jgi:hypothetical protein
MTQLLTSPFLIALGGLKKLQPVATKPTGAENIPCILPFLLFQAIWINKLQIGAIHFYPITTRAHAPRSHI